MKNRSIGMMILLTFITLGFYQIYWMVSFQSELKQKTGEGFGGLGHFILLLVTFGIYYIIWNYKVGARLEKLGEANNGLLYLILLFVGIGWLNPYLIQSQANRIPASKSISPPRKDELEEALA